MSETLSLFEFQAEGALWLVPRNRGYLAFEAGLGKTVTALAAATMSGAKKVQVVCPASVVSSWYWHAERWAPGVAVVATSYDTARRTSLRTSDILILDEAHYLKNRDAKRTRAVLKHASRCGAVWPLSATPVPNGAADLYPILYALFPEVLAQLGINHRGTQAWKLYVNTFCYEVPTPRGGMRITGTKNSAVLREAIAPHFLRKRKAEVMPDLPPLRVTTEVLSDADQSYLNWIPGFEPDVAELGELARARKALGLMKVNPVLDIVRDELETGAVKKLVIFAHHLDVIERLCSELAPFGVTGYTGAASYTERERAENAFRERLGPRVFVGQQQAAGTGTNLEAASEIILLEPSWVPGDNRQAIERIHRATSRNACRARIFMVPGTIDERIMSSIARKTRDIMNLGFGV